MPLQQGALSVNLTTKRITISTELYLYNLVGLTLTGTGATVNTNCRAAVMRKGVLVATCDSFAGPGDAFVGDLSLNTLQAKAQFTGCRDWEQRDFDFIIYDASVSGYLINDKIPIINAPLRDDDVLPGNVDPITSGTTVWGVFRVVDGVTYVYSRADGKWYPFIGDGAGDQVHLNVDGGGGINP